MAKSPEIINHILIRGEKTRCIYFLDQFGYTDVPLSEIRQILSTFQNAEVILTFATDFLIDYLSTKEATQKALQRIDIDISPEMIAEAKKFKDWRRRIQFQLHREIPLKTGAQYYTPFFIRSDDSHRDLWLIHLSQHYRARDVMVGLHWQENTALAHYGGSALNMFGYDPNLDQATTKQLLLPGFFFDDQAREHSREQLVVQLPEELHRYKDGISFGNLFSDLTNDTPVTAEILKMALGELAQLGYLVVKDKTGTVTRDNRVGPDTDVIIPNKQQVYLHW